MSNFLNNLAEKLKEQCSDLKKKQKYIRDTGTDCYMGLSESS